MSQLRHLIVLSICILILIVACARTPNPSISEHTSHASPGSCRLVEHEMGETEVCSQPKKVAALSPHILDSILALGVQPAAYAASDAYSLSRDSNIKTYDNPTEQIPYLGSLVTTQPVIVGDRKSPSLERLASLKPDVIIGEHFNNEDEYAFLTQIAPTLLFSDKDTDGQQSWKNDIQGIAQALGKELQAEELLTVHERQIAQTRAALQPVLQAYPRIFVMTFTSAKVISSPGSITGRLLKEIGFEVIQPEDIEGHTEISLEIVPQVETDLIIVLSWNTDSPADSESTIQKRWANNPLLSSMPVFQKGRVFFVDTYLWGGTTRGPIADQLVLEQLPKLLMPLVSEGQS